METLFGRKFIASTVIYKAHFTHGCVALSSRGPMSRAHSPTTGLLHQLSPRGAPHLAQHSRSSTVGMGLGGVVAGKFTEVTRKPEEETSHPKTVYNFCL